MLEVEADANDGRELASSRVRGEYDIAAIHPSKWIAKRLLHIESHASQGHVAVHAGLIPVVQNLVRKDGQGQEVIDFGTLERLGGDGGVLVHRGRGDPAAAVAGPGVLPLA